MANAEVTHRLPNSTPSASKLVESTRCRLEPGGIELHGETYFSTRLTFLHDALQMKQPFVDVVFT